MNVKLNTLSMTSKFQFTNVGGDIPTMMLVGKTDAHFTVLVSEVDGRHRMQNLPMQLFRNSIVRSI